MAGDPDPYLGVKYQALQDVLRGIPMATRDLEKLQEISMDQPQTPFLQVVDPETYLADQRRQWVAFTLGILVGIALTSTLFVLCDVFWWKPLPPW